jgi:enoyl-CoA hydratase/carnithine racemase
VTTVEDAGRVRLVGLDRPEVHNALNRELVFELLDALRDRPPEVACLILFGHGASFCAGGDRREGIAGPDGESTDTLEAIQEITRQLQVPELFTIAAVEGWAIGGGAELALACDVIVAGETSTFRFPEVELGAHATGGCTWLLPRAIGLSRATLLLLTAQALDVQTACAWGLVAEVAARGGALTSARALADRVLGFPDHTIRSLKRSLQSSLVGTLEDALVNEVRETYPRLATGGFLGPAGVTL